MNEFKQVNGFSQKQTSPQLALLNSVLSSLLVEELEKRYCRVESAMIVVLVVSVERHPRSRTASEAATTTEGLIRSARFELALEMELVELLRKGKGRGRSNYRLSRNDFPTLRTHRTETTTNKQERET